MTAIEKMTTELNKLFLIFNEHFYNGELTIPVISIQSCAKNRRTLGWCSTKKVWRNIDELSCGRGAITVSQLEDGGYYEVGISAEYLWRGVEGICGTLLHEMVHLYCLENDIKDTSRGNAYHNKTYKEVAESHGLIIGYDKAIGWSLTSLSEETRKFIKGIADEKIFEVGRAHSLLMDRKGGNGEDGEDGEDGEGKIGIDGEPIKKSSTRRYVCPNCHTIVRATKDVHIICGVCHADFELATK